MASAFFEVLTLSFRSSLNTCRLLTFFYNGLFLWNLHLKAFGAVLNEFKSARVYWQFFSH